MYENDFTTRWSAKPIPNREVWYTSSPYAIGRLCSPFISGNSWERHRYFDDNSKFQHGWFYGLNSASAMPYVTAEEDGNQFVAVCSNSGANRHVVVRQLIDNCFTDGIIEARCDIRPPRVARNHEDASSAFTLGDDYYSDKTDDGAADYAIHIASRVGFSRVGSGAAKFYHVCYADEDYDAKCSKSVTMNTLRVDDHPMDDHWYRFVVRIDVSRQRWSYKIYDMGTSHPELNSAPIDPNPIYSTPSELRCRYNIKNVASLGFATYYPTGGTVATGSEYSALSDVNNAACYDNVEIKHGASDATLETCYINDFTTQSTRRFDANASTSYTYAPVAEKSINCVSNFVIRPSKGTPVGLLYDKSGGNQTRQRIGIDGWRRLNQAGEGRFQTYWTSSGYLVFRASGNTAFVCAASPIGTSVSSGFLRAKIDFRTPTTWHHSSRFLRLGLGGYNHYHGVHTGTTATGTESYGDHRVASVGIISPDQKDNTFVPFYKKGDGSLVGANVNGPTAAKAKCWYRAIMEVNMDAKTYSVIMYEQGTAESSSTKSSANGTEVLNVKDIPIINDEPIYCVSLDAYGAGDSENEYIYFDSLLVETKANEADDYKKIYDNEAAHRTYWYRNAEDQPKLRQIITSDRNSRDNFLSGVDEWRRHNFMLGDFILNTTDEDSNPSATFHLQEMGSAWYSNVVTPIGDKFTSGLVVAQYDLRPPRVWPSLNDNAGAYMVVGGGPFYLGNCSSIGEQTSYLGYSTVRMGVRRKMVGDNYTDSEFFTTSGTEARDVKTSVVKTSTATVSSANWYRFVAEMDLDTELVTVKVYNMGTAHPTLATATPAAPVATFENLYFRASKDLLDGISSYGLFNYDIPYSPYCDRSMALFDNIKFGHDSRPSFILTIR